jgi:hypothetical protein
VKIDDLLIADDSVRERRSFATWTPLFCNGGGMDDSNTDNQLTQLCMRAFSGDTGLTALALGRETHQIEEMMAGRDEIDEDLDMKIKGVAEERNIDLNN